jgi:hypothetical protein
MNRNTPRSTAPRSSSSFAAGGAKKAQKSTPPVTSPSVDGWTAVTTTPVKGGARVVHTPEAPKKVSTYRADGRSGTAARFPASRFSAFETDSDEEAHPIIPAETPAEFFARLGREDPILAAVSNGLSWFEAENGEDTPVVKASKARIAVQREARERLLAEEEASRPPVPSAPLATEEEMDAHYLSLCHRSEEEFWAQSFTQNLDERIPDYFDTTGLTDDEFHSMLAWTYNKGWMVDVCGRESVKLVSDDGPSRRYIPDNFWTHKSSCYSHSHSHHEPKKAKTSTIPRFCRAAVCEEADCRYVHGDTIPKTNRTCGFDGKHDRPLCGASDPTGVKRSQCLFIHPWDGETWTTESCIHKPAPSTELKTE